MQASHCVQLDYGAVNWPKDAAVVIAESASIDTFFKHDAGDQLAVYVWKETLTQPLPENGRTLVGVAAASIVMAPRSRSTLSVVIHALSIKDCSQGRGLDQLLYEQLHQALFELGQQEYARWVFQEKTGDEQLPVLPLMELHVLPDSCRRSAGVLVLYANNHWQVTCNGGTDCVTKDVLKEWARVGTPLYVKEFDLSLPPISLRCGYFSPSFDIDFRIVATIPSFSEESAVRDAGCGTNFVGQMLLTEIKVIGPSLLQLSPHTGLLPFFVAAAPCRALDDFLLNPRNWVNTRGGAVPTLRVGSVRLGGFSQYNNLNSDAHDPAMQAMRTARTFNGAELKELYENAPGFALLTSAVLTHLGYPECSSEGIFSMLKAVHFFLVDESRQTSFAWHTDDTDLDITQRDVKLNLRSAVIQLARAEGRSAMQVLGFRPLAFEGRGAGALFHGAALHRSVDLVPPPHAIWKVTLFLVLPPVLE